MSHVLSMTLSDDEYAALERAAADSGQPLESVLHYLLAQRLHPTAASPLASKHDFTERQYAEGKLLNLPTREPLRSQDIAAREERARILSSGKPASDMVIEDRGPR